MKPMWGNNMRTTALALAMLLSGTCAYAADESFQPGITGDWNGLRTQLQDQGWEFEAKGVWEGAWNPGGGNHQSAAGAGELDFGAIADLGKLMGDDGGKFEVLITDRFGANLVDVAGLHTLMQVQEIFGRGDIWRLSDLSLSQDMLDKKVNLLIGRLDPGSDFDIFACNYENLGFCGSPPGNVDGEYWFNHPVSQWGARLKVNATKDVALSAGVYQVNPRNLTDGFSFDFSGGTGALIPFEADWKPKLIAGLPGEYQIGGWIGTSNGRDAFTDIHGDPLALTGLPGRIDDSRSGFFLSAKQQITGEAPPKDAPPGTNGKGLTLFLNYMQSDRRTSFLDRQFAIGAAYKGFMPSRGKDEIAVAFGTTHVNGRVADGEALQNAAGFPPQPVQHTEYVTEFDYRAAVVQGATLTPNLQWIADPGGVSGRADVVVLGLKTDISL